MNWPGVRATAFCFQNEVGFCLMILRIMKTEAPAYKRIVLKLSGEALQERGSRENISPSVVREIADRNKDVHSLGVQTSIVIGAGNVWRGASASGLGVARTTAPHVARLAAVSHPLSATT